MILWLDLETSGTDEREDPIIEVGAVLTEATPSFPIVAEFSEVVLPDDPLRVIDRMDVDVLDMHLANGLVRALVLREGSPIERVEERLLDWIKDAAPNDRSGRIPLAGSGVSHFDHRFIARQMPRLNERLTYWAYDIGAVRRFLRLYGLIGGANHEAKTHRALDDVKAHIEEAREYGRLLRSEHVSAA